MALTVGSLYIDEDSCTELESHDNMPVVGKNLYVLSDTVQTEDINSFTPDHKTLVNPVVDVAIKYECPFEGTYFPLVIRNALHVTSININLITRHDKGGWNSGE